MLFRVLILAILLSFTSFSQKEIKDYYLTKTLRQDRLQYRFSVLDDDKRGVWIFDKSKMYYWYKSQKVHNTQGGASGELLHKEFSSYYDSKQLHSQGKFSRGLKVGNWKYWRENGHLLKIENWLKGKLILIKYYSSDGFLEKELRYKGSMSISKTKDSVIVINNSKQKRVERTFDNNKLIKQESFKGGVLHGEQLIYEDGKLISKKKYKKGEEILPKEKKEKPEKEAKDSPKKVQKDKKDSRKTKSKQDKKEKKLEKTKSPKKHKNKSREKSKSKD